MGRSLAVEIAKPMALQRTARNRGVAAKRRCGGLATLAAELDIVRRPRALVVASVLSHPAVPLAVAVALGSGRVPAALTVAACTASVLPDIDSFGFWAGIPSSHVFGHRGFTHSLCFAFLLAAFGSLFSRNLGTTRLVTFAVLFVAVASHGALDALTTGGPGVAFFSPFSNRRYFLPWHVLVVSPIGVRAFFSSWGVRILKSELTWVWAPCAIVAAGGMALRRLFRVA